MCTARPGCSIAIRFGLLLLSLLSTTLIASGDFSGMNSARARQALATRLSALGIGEETVN